MGRQGLYADPMVYDILYTPGTAGEVTAFEKLERRLATGPLAPARWWFEPACGTGRYLRVAAGRGRQVAGFDRDEGQLAYARRRLGKDGARIFPADMETFVRRAAEAGLQPGTVDFAFNPVNSIRHLTSDRAMLRHFAEVAELLRPGALYVVGLSLTDYGWLLPEEDLWQTARGRCRVSQLVNYLPPVPGTPAGRIEKVISHLTVTRPTSETHFDDTYDLRTYDRKQWRDLMERSRLEHVGSFDAFARPQEDRFLSYQLEVLRRPVT
jgi:SAM-dependent methyltransferase